MKKILAAALLCFSVMVTKAQIVSVEPDDYADWAVMNHVSPFVSLITAGTNNLPHPPAPFDIWARESTFPWQPPTGNKVFSHVGVAFFYTDRRLRMDFNGSVSFVSIIFQGGNNLETMRGQLDVFGSDGQLLTTYITQPLLGGQTETMSITRPLSDIAWATAYTVPGDNPFGRLDALFFSTPVPEPGTPALLIGLGAVWAWFRRRNGALSRIIAI